MKYEEIIQNAVLHCEQNYKKMMNKTAKEFFEGLVNNAPVEEFAEQQKKWNNVDHAYMYQTEQELRGVVMKNDKVPKSIEQRANIPDKYPLDSIKKFESYEADYGDHTVEAYEHVQELMEVLDRDTVLNKSVDNYRKNVEQYIKYTGKKKSKHTIASYLSMVYNVNLTKTGWNQSLKDAEILGKDLLILETHPYSCPECADMQGKVYSISGAHGYPSVKDAEDHGVGHPNCKCEWGIYWDDKQLETQASSVYGNYEKRQKLLAINRRLNDERIKKELYKIIGNYSKVDSQQKIISRLLELRRRTL